MTSGALVCRCREPVRLEVAVEAKTPASSPVAVEVSEAPSLDVPEPQPELPPVDFALPEDPLVLAAGGAGAAFVAGGAAFLAFRSKGSAVKTLDSSKAFELLKAKPEAVLVDVRSLAEVSASGAVSLQIRPQRVRDRHVGAADASTAPCTACFAGQEDGLARPPPAPQEPRGHPVHEVGQGQGRPRRAGDQLTPDFVLRQPSTHGLVRWAGIEPLPQPAARSSSPV